MIAAVIMDSLLHYRPKIVKTQISPLGKPIGTDRETLQPPYPLCGLSNIAASLTLWVLNDGGLVGTVSDAVSHWFASLSLCLHSILSWEGWQG